MVRFGCGCRSFYIVTIYKLYKVIGAHSLLLAMTGTQQLLSPIPAPAPQCPTLLSPLNGRVSASGGTATYTCFTGYTLSGSTTRTCQTNGAWSGTAPTCNAVQCPELPHPSGGSVWLTARTPGSYAIYSCNTGNIHIGSSFRICQSDGTWSGNAPTCQGECDIGKCCRSCLECLRKPIGPFS